MDEKGDSVVETSTFTQDYYLYLIKRTLQLIVPVSLCSFLFSYLSGSSIFLSYNFQSCTFIFPLFTQALDRKYMFLICNGILAFLVKNLKFSNYGGVVEKSAEYGMQQIIELPPVLEAAAVHDEFDSEEKEGIAEEQEQEQDGDGEKEIEEIKTGDFVLEDVVLEEEEEEEEAYDVDDYDNEIKDNASVEEVNDARVSTEELNNKFEEFIRKMKEEIRIEAQQQLIAV